MNTPDKKPRTRADSLAGIRVASDDEIRAAAKAEIARIRAEIAQQKKADQATKALVEEKPSPEVSVPAPAPAPTPAPAPEPQQTNRAQVKKTTKEKPALGPRRRNQSEAIPTESSVRRIRKEAVTEAVLEVAAVEFVEVPAPQTETTVLIPPRAPRRSAKDSLTAFTASVKSVIPTRQVPTDNNIKKWERSPEESALLRTRKIRRLGVTVIAAGIAFIATLSLVIYLATGGLVQPTQGVTTEWGAASQVNTLVDKMATPHAGNHVIVKLPGTQNKEALVLGFLQGFDGTDYLVTIGEETIIVPPERMVGTVTAIWPG